MADNSSTSNATNEISNNNEATILLLGSDGSSKSSAKKPSRSWWKTPSFCALFWLLNVVLVAAIFIVIAGFAHVQNPFLQQKNPSNISNSSSTSSSFSPSKSLNFTRSSLTAVTLTNSNNNNNNFDFDAPPGGSSGARSLGQQPGPYSHHNLRSLNDNSKAINPNSQTTPECASYMDLAKRLMKPQTDPCNDFYEYACGNFATVYPLPEGTQFWRRINVIEQGIVAKVDDILRISEFNWAVHQKVKRVYDACVATSNNNTRNRDALRRIVDDMGGFAFEDAQKRVPDFSETVSALHRYNVDALFKLHVDVIKAGGQNRTYAMLLVPGSHTMIDTPSSLLNLPVKRDPRQLKYAAVLEKIADVSSSIDDRNKKLLDQGAIHDVIDFERKIASLSQSPSVVNNEANLSFEHVSELDSRFCSHINWKRNFEILLQAADLSLSGIVIDRVALNNGDRHYLRRVCALIEHYASASRGRRTMQNYLVFKALQPFYDKIESTSCVSDVASYMPLAVGPLFERATLKDEAKQSVRLMSAALRLTFTDEIGNKAKRLSNQSKRAISKLIKDVKFDVGYPDWLHDEAKLNTFYGSFAVTDSNIGNAVSAFRFEQKQAILLLKQKIEATDLTIYESPVSVNAHYSIYSNEIAIYPSIILPPYFDDAYPDVVNLGGLGTAIAHELVHVFDSGTISSVVESDSFLNSERHSCTSRQFSNSYISYGSSYRSPIANEEDLADIGGVKLAYRLYKELEARRHLAKFYPELGMTSDKLFFLAYAQTQCLAFSFAGMQQLIQGTHTPGPFRVRGALANLPEFAKAFNCPLASPMNPKAKCDMW